MVCAVHSVARAVRVQYSLDRRRHGQRVNMMSVITCLGRVHYCRIKTTVTQYLFLCHDKVTCVIPRAYKIHVCVTPKN
jgi:hypothetical protein